MNFSIKINKLHGCELRRQSNQLINEYVSGHAAIAIEDETKALICFDYSPIGRDANKCEIFDGKTSISTHATKFSHFGGKLALYRAEFRINKKLVIYCNVSVCNK